jgi:LysR family hca operon transcriptional activator
MNHGRRSAASAFFNSLLDIIPDHEVDNINHAVSMIASTGAVALLPAYPSNLLP